MSIVLRFGNPNIDKQLQYTVISAMIKECTNHRIERLEGML